MSELGGAGGTAAQQAKETWGESVALLAKRAAFVVVALVQIGVELALSATVRGLRRP